MGPVAGLDGHGVKKNLLLSAGFELRTVQRVTSRHNQYVIPATSCNLQGNVLWNPRRRKLYYLCANEINFLKHFHKDLGLVVLTHAMKAYTGNGGTALHILNLSTAGR